MNIGPKILIADDSATVRKVLVLTLQDHCGEILLAEDGAAALEMARREPPEIAIVDLLMPVLDGYRLCWHLKTELNPPSPVITLAGGFERYDRDLLQTVGGDRHLLKPFEQEELLATVRELAAPGYRPKPPAPNAEEVLAAIPPPPASAPRSGWLRRLFGR